MNNGSAAARDRSPPSQRSNDICSNRLSGRDGLRAVPNLEKSQISVCDFSTSLQIGVGSRFAEAAGAGLAPQQVRHMVRIAHEGP